LFFFEIIFIQLSFCSFFVAAQAKCSRPL